MFDPHHYDCINEEREHAWDCDLMVEFEDMSPMIDIDEEDDESDWQIVVLDRFGDRLVTDTLEGR